MDQSRQPNSDHLRNLYTGQHTAEQERQWDAADAADDYAEHKLRHKLKRELVAITLLGLVSAAGVWFFVSSSGFGG